MFDRSISQESALQQIRKYAGENRAIMITLRDRSRILGCGPMIVGAEKFQFCSLESGLPIAFSLDEIWSIGARLFDIPLALFCEKHGN
jgi:hypothetical protein